MRTDSRPDISKRSCNSLFWEAMALISRIRINLNIASTEVDDMRKEVALASLHRPQITH